MKKVLLILLVMLSFSVKAQIDSTYYYKSKEILDKFPKSRVTAEDLYESAKKIYCDLGIIVPYRLAISQAIIETSLGNVGVGKSKNNPFSLNSKSGYKKYLTIKEGILDYYFFIAKNYLSCRSVEQLLNNFINCSKKRYAVSKDYEKKLKRTYKLLLK
jgi:flagellum-specific peptidoglycan hydrolase FlgJ